MCIATHSIREFVKLINEELAMYRIFRKTTNKGRSKSPKFDQYRKYYNKNLEHAIDYYKHHPLYINNNHPLLKIILGNAHDINDLPNTTHDAVRNNLTGIAVGQGMNSSSNPGDTIEDVFYTKNCIMTTIELSNGFNLPNWRDIRAVRVLAHPFTNLEPWLATNIAGDDSDYSVVGIDIPLLLVQYSGWLKEQEVLPVLERQTPGQFVMAYVITGMIPEQMDISLRNRLLNGKEGIFPRNPFHFVTYENELDVGMELIIDRYIRSKTDLTTISQNIPMLYADTLKDAVPPYLNGLNMYSYWVMLLVITDWTLAIMLPVQNVEKSTDKLPRKMQDVKRYMRGTRSDKFIDKKFRHRWRLHFDKLDSLI